jgi:peroxiredoxin
VPPLKVPKIGELASDFELPCVSRTQVRLSDYRGFKPVVIAFTRIFTDRLFCPYCYPHINELNQRYQEFKDNGAELLMVSSTDHEQSQRIVDSLNLSYPLLIDPACHTFRQYGVGQALGAPLPGQFIIDIQGRIVFRHLFSFIDGHASTNKILLELRKLKF